MAKRSGCSDYILSTQGCRSLGTWLIELLINKKDPLWTKEITAVKVLLCTAE